MRNFWNQVPLLRFAFALIAGIGLEIYVDNVLHFSKVVLPVVGCVLLISSIAVFVLDNLKVELKYRFRIANGVSISLLLIAFGFVLTWLNAEKNSEKHFGRFLRKENFLTATITKPPLDKEKVITVVAEINHLENEKISESVKGKILINFLRDTLTENLKYGDVVVFNSSIEEFDEPKNPDEFSFKLYQSFHNIYHRTFLKTGDWKLIVRNQGNFFFAFVYQWRERFLGIIQEHVKDRNDFAVASAIMLGYNDYMNGDIVRAYASSGALHVLSVSGLHVGIMFFMLNSLLKWMDNRGRKMEIVKSTSIILFIWFYACLTGLSPSVLRSATMFSMIQVGKTIVNRSVSTYNIIAGSALLLILYDPFIVTEVGFRLSYLAVIGIIYLQPKIYKLITVKNRFLDQAWMIIAVSLAAQIATFPLSLFYFHQFPNLFLLSNLAVIPLSNFVLFNGTALFVVSSIPYAGAGAGWAFSHLLWLLNKFIFWIDSIPWALWQPLTISMFEMILIYILILLLCWLTEERRTKVLIASLLIVFGLCSFNIYESVSNNFQKKIVVYHVPKQSAVAFLSSRKVFYDFDEELLGNYSAMLFHIKHHWWNCGVKEEAAVGSSSSSRDLPFGKIVLFEGVKIIEVDSSLEKINFSMQKKLKVDLVIISHSPKIYLNELQKLFDFNEVVFDTSNKKWRVKKWKDDCAKLKIKFWDVSERGAYVKDIL